LPQARNDRIKDRTIAELLGRPVVPGADYSFLIAPEISQALALSQ